MNGIWNETCHSWITFVLLKSPLLTHRDGRYDHIGIMYWTHIDQYAQIREEGSTESVRGKRGEVRLVVWTCSFEVKSLQSGGLSP